VHINSRGTTRGCGMLSLADTFARAYMRVFSHPVHVLISHACMHNMRTVCPRRTVVHMHNATSFAIRPRDLALADSTLQSFAARQITQKSLARNVSMTETFCLVSFLRSTSISVNAFYFERSCSFSSITEKSRCGARDRSATTISRSDR